DLGDAGCPGHCAAHHDCGAVPRIRCGGDGEIRQDRCAGQHQSGELIQGIRRGGRIAQDRAADVYQTSGSRGHRAARRYRPSAAWSERGTRARRDRNRVANRPVRFIVPLAPGGGLDFVARVVGESVSRAIGQQIVIENRTGAGGTVGIETAIKSPPDGYSVLVTNDNVASAPHILKLGIDYLKELVPVIQLARQPLALAAHPSLAVSSVAGDWAVRPRARVQTSTCCWNGSRRWRASSSTTCRIVVPARRSTI